ncbi:phage terminase, small subunit, putative, P27 family [Alkalithermobacter thermoalcaliphilus JW-YL-7 = DSM 7308]|uniref:Phage terminase, small subunit, P27 family n=1 Tax=Alkalithermobacter thermoalcaliphilus JW-YL-7 = DSM 7308 TaxID=1121328 RepID=A0A150FR21_CLOPD|nr:phage terminase, small subunit, P27 family [[Clostridium] paradoxum JW-YL-7 = DSM 7308]SHL13418.1 phage terminase, small subunit, putative, P27 family [[Clostridium] paradoxum JW-YL-7 = DSM 7308]
MARPCKSAKVIDKYSQTKFEIQARIEAEEKLRGTADKIIPPKHLNSNQKKIFKKIVEMLKASEILGNPDVYILAQTAIAIDRLQEIEKFINEDTTRMFDKNVMSAKDKYTKDFFRCCNELSLSPQSRAKLGNINLQAKQQQEDPLLKVLRGGAE